MAALGFHETVMQMRYDLARRRGIRCQRDRHLLDAIDVQPNWFVRLIPTEQGRPHRNVAEFTGI